MLWLARIVLPLFLMCILMSQTFAQSSSVSICRFKDDKPAAISLTFDDDLLDHYTVAKPLLAQYGFKGTFFVVEKYADQAIANRADTTKRQYMSWDQVKEMAADGHEIGNHSYSHYQLTKAKSQEDVIHEITHPIATFQEKLGITPVTFCFPGNARNDEILKITLAHHINARTYQQGFGGEKYTHQQTVDWLEKTIANKQWGVAMLHAIIHEGHGYAPFPNDEKDFVAVLDLLKANADKLWIDTFANVSKYVKLRDAASVQWIEPDRLLVLKTELDPKVYDLPLTVKITKNGQSCYLKMYANSPITLQQDN